MQTIHRFQNYVYSGLSQFFYIIWAAWFCLISHTALAQPVLDIQQWKTYGPLAEQGAICASFAAIMESQDVITPDLGHLWTERRKFSGALIRKTPLNDPPALLTSCCASSRSLKISLQRSKKTCPVSLR